MMWGCPSQPGTTPRNPHHLECRFRRITVYFVEVLDCATRIIWIALKTIHDPPTMMTPV